MSKQSVSGADSRLARVDPLLLALAGAACTSLSGVLVKASGANAGTAAFLRCALALTLLVPMSVAELRRIGWRPRRLVLIDTAAGLLLGVDYVLWAASIGEVGAGIATVLLNAQLVVFPVLARMFTGTPIRRSFLMAAPVMLAGVALSAGITGPSTAEGDPFLGLAYGCAAGAAYAGYLFLSRLGGGSGHTATPVCVATLAGALSAGALGAWWSGIDLASLDPRAWGWLALLALTGQVLTWILVGAALPRLAPSSAAAVLVLPPVLAVGAGALLLGERATPVQLAGCALVLLAVWASERAARAATHTARRT